MQTPCICICICIWIYICVCILPWESGDICILGTYADAVDVVKGGRCKAKLLLIGRPKITQICESKISRHVFTAQLNCPSVWDRFKEFRLWLRSVLNHLCGLTAVDVCFPKSIWTSVYFVKTIWLRLFILSTPCNCLNEKGWDTLDTRRRQKCTRRQWPAER